MSHQQRSAACTRCGSGFVLTSTYRDLLNRRNVKVVVPVLCPTCFLTKGPLPKQRGEVKWFNPQRHYGFIQSEAGEEVFFHEKQLFGTSQNGLQEGQEVRFHVHYPVKGPEALNVEVLAD
ncbi:MAG: cold shock domain-containing protein [Anaerolineae bacterium]|nr:cold shock domain-containing protein [Anaerolineae bacterium]